ncbi:short-chain collagen C4-like [Babylonia areolata]|uniref:short-chain collagen C4-like n=1 Tax=Babylonia areolata TaxID=304850 RepID=UPI003FD29046
MKPCCEAEELCTSVETKLKAMEAKLNTAETKLEAAETALVRSSQERGSIFVRWGRKTCTNHSQLVYEGAAGGSQFYEEGAAANTLCLTLEPEFDDTPVPEKYRGELHGAEYGRIPDIGKDYDVPCSVCRASQSTTIMIPATSTCPTGWTAQYAGHLAAGYRGHEAASEYVCLDKDPEYASSDQVDDDGRLFHYTVTVCGSLPCPPYKNEKVALCVVCSK